MTYRVRLDGDTHIQFHTLPKDGRDALIERATDLAERPWDNATMRPPWTNPRVRETVFGGGKGILLFTVDDDA